MVGAATAEAGTEPGLVDKEVSTASAAEKVSEAEVVGKVLN